MKNSPTTGYTAIGNPTGYLSIRRADHMRRHSDDHRSAGLPLLGFRLRRGDAVTPELKEQLYTWVLRNYELT
jgi:hypothetical protein